MRGDGQPNLKISYIFALKVAVSPRSSATAERQRVSYARLSWIAHWSCISLNTASVVYNYIIDWLNSHRHNQLTKRATYVADAFKHYDTFKVKPRMVWNHSSLASFFVADRHSVTYGQLRKPQHTYVKRTLRWIGHSRLFQIILVGAGRNPERCVVVMQLIPTLFLKRTKIWQRENGKFVDFSDPTQVWRRPGKKRLRISTNYLYCQKLDSLTYIFAANSVGLHSLVFT